MRMTAVVFVLSAGVLSACSALPSLSDLPIPNVFAVPPSPWTGPPSAAEVTVVTPAPIPAAGRATPSQPVHGLAVTRPPATNDFPVTYRVQVPAVDERVRLMPEAAQPAGMTIQIVQPSRPAAPPGVGAVTLQRQGSAARSSGSSDDQSYVH